MDDYLPHDPYPDHIFETLIEIIGLRSGHDIKVLTAPPTFFDDPDDEQPIVLGFAGTVYVLFNTRFTGTCSDDDTKKMCTCVARDVALSLGAAYVLQFQSEMGSTQP